MIESYGGLFSGSELVEGAPSARAVRAQGRVLGVATLFASATQLRAAGSVGPGEVLIVGVLSLTWMFGQPRSGRQLSTATSRTLSFFLAMSVAGALLNAFVFRDGYAAALGGLGDLCLLTALMFYVATRSSPDRLLAEWAWVFGTGFIATQTVLFVAARIGVPTPPFEPMYFGVRFEGWTNNPNQFALLIVVAGAAVALSARRAWWVRTMFVLASLVLAVESKSDGFRLAALTSVGAVVITYLTSPTRALRPGRRLAGLMAIGLGAAAVVAKFSTFVAVAKGVESSGNQGASRLSLWGSCAGKIVEAPLTGLGPGPHATLQGLSGLIECHNTLLDVSASAGVPAGLALVALAAFLLHRAWRRGDVVVIATVTAIGVMLLFGYLLRYTQLWLLLAFVEFRVVAPARSRPRPTRT